MIFEHFALNVADVKSMVSWYRAHLGLRVKSAREAAPFTTFLADGSGRVMMELYQRDDADRLPYGRQHPLTFHIAFMSEDAATDRVRLEKAGATFVEEVRTDDDSHLIMLRDPWGLPLQLCQRAVWF